MAEDYFRYLNINVPLFIFDAYYHLIRALALEAKEGYIIHYDKTVDGLELSDPTMHDFNRNKSKQPMGYVIIEDSTKYEGQLHIQMYSKESDLGKDPGDGWEGATTFDSLMFSISAHYREFLEEQIIKQHNEAVADQIEEDLNKLCLIRPKSRRGYGFRRNISEDEVIQIVKRWLLLKENGMTRRQYYDEFLGPNVISLEGFIFWVKKFRKKILQEK